MFDISISENGKEIYSKKNQKYALGCAGSNNEFIIKGEISWQELINLLTDMVIFIHNTISSNYDRTYSIDDLLEDALINIHDICSNNQAIIKCSNPEDITKATNLLLRLANTNGEIIGIDYDELKNQMGEDNEENN